MLNLKSQLVAGLHAPSRGLNRSLIVATRCDVVSSLSCDISIMAYRSHCSSESQLKSQRVAAPYSPAIMSINDRIMSNQRIYYSPGHTLRCYTPTMVSSKGAAMPQNFMRCAAIKSSTCSIICSRFWNTSAIYSPIFK